MYNFLKPFFFSYIFNVQVNLAYFQQKHFSKMLNNYFQTDVLQIL